MTGVPTILLHGLNWIIILGILCGVGYCGAYRQDSLTPGILLSMIIIYFFLVPAGFLLLTDRYKYPHPEPLRALTAVLILLGASSLVFYVVYSRKYPAVIDTITRRLPQRDRVPPRHLLAGAMIWLTVGITGYLLYAFLNGGIVRMFTVEPRLAFQVTPNTARYRILSWLGVFTALVLAVTAFVGMRDHTRRDYASVLAIVVVSGFVLVSYRSRLIIGFLFGYLILVAHYHVRRLEFPHVVGLFVAGVIFAVVLPLLEHLSGGGSIAVVFGEIVYRYRLEPLMAVITHVPEDVSYQLGQTFTTIVWFDWLMKSLTVENIVEIIVMGENRPHYSLSPTAIGELYLNFGVIGVFLGSAIYGALLKLLYKVRAESQSYLATGFYPAFLYPLLVMLPGSVAWGFRTFVWPLFVPLLVTVVVITVVNGEID